ncbi:hypothetical protein FTV88_0469 [Heliorestis convoluta]|uniref:Uncharacterized protein n=1 Tax=Heliorestis convoluta TaxID=356322 RepID=A0A5Q2MWB7_9FIRM|nr:hypothetical protein FTV88_0469 [Heliorestis convoluta]
MRSRKNKIVSILLPLCAIIKKGQCKKEGLPSLRRQPYVMHTSLVELWHCTAWAEKPGYVKEDLRPILFVNHIGVSRHFWAVTYLCTGASPNRGYINILNKLTVAHRINPVNLFLQQIVLTPHAPTTNYLFSC